MDPGCITVENGSGVDIGRLNRETVVRLEEG